MILETFPIASEGGPSNLPSMAEEQLVFRAMARELDGKPRVARNRSSLGVVVAADPDTEGMLPDVTPLDGRVGPNGEGLSVALGTPLNLPIHRRPAQFGGGTGRHPVFALPAQAVPSTLELHADSPVHAVIQSATWVPLRDYEDALRGTRTNWREITK
jgi:hypothetical protein